MAFGDVIKRITRGAQLNAKALDEITTTVPTDMQYLMLANIKNGLIDKKLNEPCAHPDIRTFSYEALGVNVSSMVHDIFGIDLLWYAKGSLPLYTCVVAGLLSNQMMLDDRIIAKIKEFR